MGPAHPIAIAFAAAIACTTSAAAPASSYQTSVDSGISEVSLGYYKAAEPKSLEELPPAIRKRLQAHLIDRLGEPYLAKLTFAGGQVVNFDDLYRDEPNARNYKWTIFAYRLCFRITAPDKGITQYVAAIELDKDAKVIRDIDLPPVRRLPHKADFIPLSQAYKTAAKNGFDIQHTGAELTYETKVESIVYRLSQTIAYTPPTGTDRVIEIDAHTGRVLGIRKSGWIE